MIVGGIAAVAHGASYVTRDFDALTPLSVENCGRILRALGPLSPRFYQAHGKPLVSRSAIEPSKFRNLYFDTSLGVVDLLGSLPPIGDYATVAGRAVPSDPMTLERRTCRVLGPNDLITVKAFVGRPKEKVVEVAAAQADGLVGGLDVEQHQPASPQPEQGELGLLLGEASPLGGALEREPALQRVEPPIIPRHEEGFMFMLRPGSRLGGSTASLAAPAPRRPVVLSLAVLRGGPPEPPRVVRSVCAARDSC